MKNNLIISGRKSMLSRAQIESFATEIEKAGIQSEIRYIQTFGDINTAKPIHSLEITNPFVKEVHQALIDGTAHIGVSSLKDVEITSPNNEIETIYFSPRKNPRDTILLGKNALQKIQNGEKITIGTSSLRRAFFLQKYLLKILPNNTEFEIVQIRGNVTTRISMINTKCDAIVLAVAGIIRLYENEKYHGEIKTLLANTKSVLLPISHFPTPPGQGVVIAQMAQNSINNDIKKQVSSLSCPKSKQSSYIEKKEFSNYGNGCRQAYGVTHLSHKGHQCTFVSGMNSGGVEIGEYKNFKNPPKFAKIADTRILKNTFKVKFLKYKIPNNINKFIVSNIKSITSNVLFEVLKNADEVWAAGFETMQKLTSMGVICAGCLESLGVEAMEDLYFASKFAFNPHEYCILTHKNARNFDDKFHKIYTYELILNEDLSEINTFKALLQKCDAVFWSSINYYELLKFYFKSNIHITLLGNTYNHLLSQKIQPYGFFNHQHLDFYLQKCQNIQH